MPEPLDRVRAICLPLPEVTERISHGAPTFFVRERKTFVNVYPEGMHQNQFAHLWCAAPPGDQEALVGQRPERFFRPPYVGGRGWLGVRLDGDPDWTEIAELCVESYRIVAPKRLVQQLDAGPVP